MIIVRLFGGLGNQLFQYAAARRLSYVLESPLVMDTSAFAKSTLRSFSLDPFNISQIFVNKKELLRIIGPQKKGVARLIYKIRRKLGYSKEWKIIREAHVSRVDDRVLSLKGNIYLDGYWQSEKYFIEIQDIIREELKIKYQQDKTSAQLAVDFGNVESISIHVRRSDYVSDSLTNKLHDVCGLDYYKESIHYIAKRVANPHFYIFSDDPEWANTNLNLDYPTTLISHNLKSRDYEDLRLMSMCKHHIIANSSFSWWGAWLNPNPAKIVLAPHKWFNDPRYDTSDVIPDTWIKVKVKG